MIVGVNYPWRHYGGDFGRTGWGGRHGVASAAASAEIAADFAHLATLGVQVVRWFVFTDARGGVRIDEQGWPDGVQDEALADLDAALALAAAAGLQLVPVLFDHTLAFRATEHGGVRLGGHGAWLAERDGQARLLDRVLAPVVTRYGPRGAQAALAGAVHAWDLLNEPDWIVRDLAPSPRVEWPVPFDLLAPWVAEAAALVHRAHGRVTVGGARLRFAGWWDDPRFGLDYLQAHMYYDPRHDFDLLATPIDALGLRRPLVIGECSAHGDAADPARGRPSLDARTLAAVAAAHGYLGTWPWSWRGVDRQGAVPPDTLAGIAADAAARAAAGAATTQRMASGGRSGSGQASPS